MDKAQIETGEALYAMCLGAMAGASQVLGMLASQGLARPREVEAFEHGLTAPLAALDNDFARGLLASIEANVGKELARIHRIARDKNGD